VNIHLLGIRISTSLSSSPPMPTKKDLEEQKKKLQREKKDLEQEKRSLERELEQVKHGKGINHD
jgi:hypothetical protein